jgi:hypothetical protein
VRLVAVGVLLTIGAGAGIVDAAANAQLVPRYMAALLILGSLALMFASLGVASRSHSALAINTLLSAGSVIMAHLAFTFLFFG